MFTESAEAFAGMLQDPARANVRLCPATRLGPPRAPFGPRVSTSRQGAIVKKEADAARTAWMMGCELPGA
jgi:hypothetical protein